MSALASLPRTYRIAKGWRVFIYVFSILLIPLFVWVGLLPFTDEKPFHWGIALLMVGVSLSMIALFGWGLVETYRGKVVLAEDRLTIVEAFKTKELLFSQIQGYKTDPNYLRLVPVGKELPTLKISTFTGRFNELSLFLQESFPDLDATQYAAEEQAILASEDFGRTAEEREQKLTEVRRVANLLNYSALGVALWTMAVATPYELMIALCLAVPLLVLLALWFYKGLIRINEQKNSAYPGLTTALVMSSCALALRALLDFEILKYQNLWTPVLSLTLLLAVLLVRSTNEFSFAKASDYFTVLVVTMLMVGYAYGGCVIINCFYDPSTPQVYQAEVLKKRIDRGKATTYHFTLTAWGPRTESKEVSVSEELYEQVQVGHPVSIYVGKGLLEVPWFVVDKE